MENKILMSTQKGRQGFFFYYRKVDIFIECFSDEIYV